MLLFGSLALVIGLLAGFAALIHRRWWILLQSLVSVAIAILTLIWAEATASILLYAVAAWTLITGIVELVGSRRLDRDVSNERLLRWSGLVSIIFAALVIVVPTTGVLSVAQMFAAFAIIFGLLMLAFSLNLRNMGKYTHSMSHS
jgi:uncharacterized membrane protein HdeD (DUF308 family)